MKLIEITPGEYIGNVAAQMAAIATREGQLVSAKFNDILLTASPFEHPASILARYDQDKEKARRISRKKEREEHMNDSRVAEGNRKIERARTMLEAYNRNPNLFTAAAMANALEKLSSLCRELVEERPGTRCLSCGSDCMSAKQEERI